MKSRATSEPNDDGITDAIRLLDQLKNRSKKFYAGLHDIKQEWMIVVEEDKP
jgi:hypothetical protein